MTELSCIADLGVSCVHGALNNKVRVVHRLRVLTSDAVVAACPAIDPMPTIYGSRAEYLHVIEFERRNRCCASEA